MAGKWMVTRARKMTPNKEAVTLSYTSLNSDVEYDASVRYPYARVKPMDETFHQEGMSVERASITLFQEGSPAVSPASGMKIVDASSREWLIEFVRSKHQWDDEDAAHWGIYNCDAARVPRASEV